MIAEFLFYGFALVLVWTFYKCCFGSSQTENSKSTLWNMYGNNSFEAIADNFTSLEAVTDAVKKCGLESSNLIFGAYHRLNISLNI